jgi:hypothetical protein
VLTSFNSDFSSSPQSASRLNENQTKINQLKEDQEECEKRLEKERDIYASFMFDLLAEEDNISGYIVDYVKREFVALSAFEFALNCDSIHSPQINEISTAQRYKKSTLSWAKWIH